MWKILTNNYMIELLPLNFVQQLLFALLLLDEYEIIYVTRFAKMYITHKYIFLTLVTHEIY